MLTKSLVQILHRVVPSIFSNTMIVEICLFQNHSTDIFFNLLHFYVFLIPGINCISQALLEKEL